MRFWHDGYKIIGKRTSAAFDGGKLTRRHVTASGQTKWFAKCTERGCTGEYCFTQATKAGALKKKCPIHSKKFFVEGNGTSNAKLAAFGQRVLWKKREGGSGKVAHISCEVEECGKSSSFSNNRTIYRCLLHSSWRRRHRPYESIYRLWVGNQKKRSAERKFPLKVAISYDQFVHICETDKVCFYCGEELKRGPYTYKPKGGKHYSRAVLLERINPFDHYTIENVVSACGQCNLSKNLFVSMEEMQVVAALRRGRWEDVARLIQTNKQFFVDWGECSRALTVFGLFGHKTPDLARSKVSAYLEAQRKRVRRGQKGRGRAGS